MICKAICLFLLLACFTTPSFAQTISRMIYDEFANITDEQKAIMTFNYTTLLFRPDRARAASTPTTFAFDPNSPFKELVPQDKINPGLSVPSIYNFHLFPANDVLAPLYSHELQQEEKLSKKRFGAKISESSRGGKHQVDPHLVDKEHMKLMLENAFTLPRHSDRNASLADSIGQYIMRKFGRLGLLTGTQPFYPTQFHRFFWDDGADISEGSNIIGIYPGTNYGTREDKILVVGAHWDTTGFTDGYNDNGSGVAAMIDVARALVKSKCQLKYSVIFVAFDKEEVGSQGSHEFIRGFLVPTVFKGSGWPEFQGAIIMDTIMNYNTSSGSQLMPEAWLERTGAEEENEARGDFISLLSRSGPEKVLAGALESHWNSLTDDEDYKKDINANPTIFRMRRFEIELGAEMPTVEELAEHIQFLRSDHARFWYNNETDYRMSLRGVLFTDTGPYRGAMRQCYHRECDSKRRKFKGSFASYDFLAQTVQTVIDTVSELSGASCPASARQQRMKRFALRDTDKWTLKEHLQNGSDVDAFFEDELQTTLSEAAASTEIPHTTAEAMPDEEEEEMVSEAASGATTTFTSSASMVLSSPLYLLYSIPWIPPLTFAPQWSLSSFYLPWVG